MEFLLRDLHVIMVIIDKYQRHTIGSVSPVHTSYNVEATLSNARRRTILSTKSKQTVHVLFNLFRICRKDEILQ